MQKKTVYLAGKITGDPFYRSKFYEAQKKLEEGGFIVVNPGKIGNTEFSVAADLPALFRRRPHLVPTRCLLKAVRDYLRKEYVGNRNCSQFRFSR